MLLDLVRPTSGTATIGGVHYTSWPTRSAPSARRWACSTPAAPVATTCACSPPRPASRSPGSTRCWR
ncbi:MAG: hypothetical protein R2734_09905 [Nocardioides sp.]